MTLFLLRPSDDTVDHSQTRQFERPASHTDDFAGNTTSTGTIAGDAAVRGELEETGDRDWFQVQLVAGRTYTFNMEGAPTNAGTLTDPFLVLRDANGAFISQDDNSGTSDNARITFTPTTSGTYWLEARSIAASNDTGSYAVSASFTNDDQTDGSIDAANLDGSNGFVLNGIDALDYSGLSVSAAGDVNGDGIGDLIIGARGGDPNAVTDAGEIYVVFGSSGIATTGTIALSALGGTNGFIINGIDSGDSSGFSVSAAGDVNGDGIDDLIIGARLADPNSTSSGESYVVFGSSVIGATGVVALSDLDGTNGFIINGIDVGDGSGISVSAAGDVNNDGFDDVIIGANGGDPNGNSGAGESYLVFGGQNVGSTGTVELSALNGTNGFVINGIDAGDGSGMSVSAAGDVNRDGFDDVIIGASNADANGDLSGESYVVFGATDVGGTGVVELSALNGTTGFVINGIDIGDYSGVSVSAAGDVNGDGFDDVIIGAYAADPNGSSRAGESYVVFGGLNIGSSGVFELSALDGTNGFAINGIDAMDYSGSRVSAAGDVNGDGFADLIIGANGGDPSGNAGAGESYVVFGSATLGGTGTFELSTLDGTNGFVVNGIDSGDSSGSVSGAGDINGDGIDDVIIGAERADPNSNSAAGESYVIFGIDESEGFIVNGTDPLDQSGRSVSPAGDVNGDGIDDFVIGAANADPNGNSDAGETIVIFGTTTAIGPSNTLDLSALDGTNGFIINGIDAGDQSGFSVSNAGDVNGDGVDDLIIGARNADPNDNESGESYVVFGATNVGGTGTVNLSALDGTNGFVINGVGSRDYSGWSVSAAGDVNGDGFDDLIIGARGGDPNGNDSGESYVVFGAADIGSSGAIALSGLNGFNGFVINGIGARDYSGWSVSAAGDVNGDSFDDLIIGARGGDPNGNGSGESYVIFGAPALGGTGTINLSTLNGTNGFVINGVNAGDEAGFSVSSAGDVNGDGLNDLIIGASGGDPNGNADAGESYVVFGATNLGAAGAVELSSLNGTNGFVINGIDSGDGSGFTVSAAGDVNGDGFDDVIIGAASADPAGNTDAGESYVVFGGLDVGATGVIELSALNGSNGFVINGIDAGDDSGFSVAAAGDVNNDGFSDLIIGATGGSPNANDRAGETYVLYGSANIGSGGVLNLSNLVSEVTTFTTASSARTAGTDSSTEGYVTATFDADSWAIVDDTLLT